jgi:hypothetical protein
MKALLRYGINDICLLQPELDDLQAKTKTELQKK